MKEYYKRHRPRKLANVIGQDAAIASLNALLDRDALPHVLLFSGPSGCGKTTIARILKNALDCGDADFFEINAAETKGIDMIRDIQRGVGLSPMDGSTRIWLIDECHKLTSDAQNAFLKLLEDTPSHVYFFLATTDPQKLLKTIHTRSTEIILSGMSPGAIKELLERVIAKEGLTIGEDVMDSIIEAAEGSARKALVVLEQCGSLIGDRAQLEAISASCMNRTIAFDLAKAICLPGRQWGEVAKMLGELKEEDPEGIRYMILGFARTMLLKGGKMAPHSFKVIEIFSEPFYNSKNAGLAAACYEVICM